MIVLIIIMTIIMSIVIDVVIAVAARSTASRSSNALTFGAESIRRRKSLLPLSAGLLAPLGALSAGSEAG